MDNGIDVGQAVLLRRLLGAASAEGVQRRFQDITCPATRPNVARRPFSADDGVGGTSAVAHTIAAVQARQGSSPGAPQIIPMNRRPSGPLNVSLSVVSGNALGGIKDSGKGASKAVASNAA